MELFDACDLYYIDFIYLTFIFSACPSTVYKDVKGFGPGCKYRCNCKNNDQCDENGECPQGCLYGWMGPACQYRMSI
jgi:hypothetical protein